MTKNAITFENGNRAVVITAPRDASAKAILDALKIASPHAVILLFGGAAGLEDSRKTRLATLFAEGVTPVAAELGALIIDGGTQSGVIAMMGEAVAQLHTTVQLLGIAPEGKITNPEIAGASKIPEGASLEPNHSHFVSALNRNFVSIVHETSRFRRADQKLAGAMARDFSSLY